MSNTPSINPLEEQTLYCLALSRIKGLDKSKAKKLLDRIGSAGKIFHSSRADLIKILEPGKNVAAVAENITRFTEFHSLKEEIEKAGNLGVNLLPYENENFPPGLKNIPDPPLVLFMLGEILPRDTLSLAIVGTRRAGDYGRRAARWIGRELASRGITVVSGMADGIDTEGHLGALEAGENARTIAIMGTGIDLCFPAGNRNLKKRIQKAGAVISELSPGTPGEKWTFPARNRIIAGISLGTIVVEAPEKSGALITARLAADYNREVFALPGNITSKNSVGCNRLIQEGAKAITNIEDILEEFDFDANFPQRKEEQGGKSTPDAADEAMKKIFSLIGDEGAHPEQILQECDLPASKVNATLLRMELEGFVRKMPTGLYVKVL